MRSYYARLVLLMAALWLWGCGAAPTNYSFFARRPVSQGMSDPGDLRVMSFNLRTKFILDGPNHWNHRKSLVAQSIRNFSPDLLGTQECLVSQANYLQSQLPGYQFSGAGRDDGKTDGEMCAIFFRKDKFTRLNGGNFWLSEDPFHPGTKSWGSSYRRMVTWVKLQPSDGGTPFYFFNTHLDNSASRARVQQAWLLRRMIDAIADGEPTVVTGDFNTDSDTTPYQLLVSGPQNWRGYLVDTYRQVNPMPSSHEGTRHNFHGGTGGDRIDWIITTNNFTTLSAAIDRTNYKGQYPSDHFPVTAVVRMQPDAPFAGHRSAEVGGS